MKTSLIKCIDCTTNICQSSTLTPQEYIDTQQNNTPRSQHTEYPHNGGETRKAVMYVLHLTTYPAQSFHNKTLVRHPTCNPSRLAAARTQLGINTWDGVTSHLTRPENKHNN